MDKKYWSWKRCVTRFETWKDEHALNNCRSTWKKTKDNEVAPFWPLRISTGSRLTMLRGSCKKNLQSKTRHSCITFSYPLRVQFNSVSTTTITLRASCFLAVTSQHENRNMVSQKSHREMKTLFRVRSEERLTGRSERHRKYSNSSSLAL